MTLKITHKHATTTGTLPTASDIDVGELAINAADAELYTKDTSGEIKRFAAVGKALYDSSGTLIDPKIPTGVFYRTSEYHEGLSLGGACYKVCASNSASDMGRTFYTYVDHVLPTGQVLKLIPDELNSVKASQCGVKYSNPLDGGSDDTAKLQAATNFVFDVSGSFTSSGDVDQPKGSVVYIEGTIFITDTIFSRSGRVTFIGTNWRSTGFRWAGAESTQPMFNMGYASTGGFRDVGIVANSSAGNRAAYCVASDFTDLGFEFTRVYLGGARYDLFLLFKSFALQVQNAGSGYANGSRLATTGGAGSGMLVEIGVNSSGNVTTAKLSHIGDFKYSPALDSNSLNDGTTVTDYLLNDVITVQGGNGDATLKLITVPRDNAITNLTFQNCFLAIASDQNGYVVKCEAGAGGKRPINFASCTVIANNADSSKAGGLLNATAATNNGFAVNVHSCRIEYQKENSIYESTNFALVNVDCDSTSASTRTSIKLSGCVGFISDIGFQDAYIARGTKSGSISLTYDGNLSGFGGIYYSDVSEDFAPKLASTASVSNAGGLYNYVQFGKSSLISADYATRTTSNDGWWIDRGDLVLTSDGEGDYLTPGIEDDSIYSFSSTGFQSVGKANGLVNTTNLTAFRVDGSEDENFGAIRLRPRLAIRIIGGGANGADLDTHIVSITNGSATVATSIVIADTLLSTVIDASIQPIGAPLRQGWFSPRSTLPSAPAATTGQPLWSQDLQAQAYYVQRDVNVNTGVEYAINKWVWGPTRSVTTAERNNIDYSNNFKAFVGSCVFDTDLGKPVWWNKTKWVDATGADAD